MRINKLVLHRSKRLAFNEIETLTYAPEHLHQLILGTNGSGKSSMMNELSPLPANPQDYFTGGYKLIDISHRGKHYTLRNDFSSKGSGRHEFICDGEELNPGGTVTVQKQLVLDHFMLDTELFELLIGVSNFREMSPTARRKWLIRMADDNMEDAIRLYNETKSLLKEKQAVAKHLSGQIVSGMEDINKLQEQTAELTVQKESLEKLVSQISELMYKHTPIDSGIDLAKIDQRINAFDTSYSQLIAIDVEPMVYDEDDLISYRLALQSQLDKLSGRVEQLKSEFARINQTLSKVSGMDSKETLMIRINELNKEISEIGGQISRKLEWNPEQFTLDYGATMSLDASISEAIMNLPDTSDGRYGKEAYLTAKNQMNNDLIKVTDLTNEITKWEHILNHITGDDHVSCPKCQHRFYPGMERHDVDTVKGKLKQLHELRDEYNGNVLKAQMLIDEIQAYVKMYNSIKEMLENSKLSNVLDYMTLEFTPTTDHPSKLQRIWERWKKDIKLYNDLHERHKTLTVLNGMLKTLDDNPGFNISDERERALMLETMIRDMELEIVDIRKRLDRVNWNITLFDKVKTGHIEVAQMCDSVFTMVDDYVVSVIHKFLRQELGIYSAQLHLTTTELQRIDGLTKRITDMNEQLNTVNKDIVSCKILLDELSPVNGLIADYSLSFVKQFTDQMNAIISDIWTYDMQIQPDVNDDLTYKFPLYMAGSDTHTPDINRASTAQKGVIDFAFKLLLINYLGLEDYPLYIDELTPNLDETHRINIMAYVRDFVESGRCSQMFMISHYVDGNNVFPQADFVIINDSNLLNKPLSYNKHLEIKYR